MWGLQHWPRGSDGQDLDLHCPVWQPHGLCSPWNVASLNGDVLHDKIHTEFEDLVQNKKTVTSVILTICWNYDVFWILRWRKYILKVNFTSLKIFKAATRNVHNYICDSCYICIRQHWSGWLPGECSSLYHQLHLSEPVDTLTQGHPQLQPCHFLAWNLPSFHLGPFSPDSRVPVLSWFPGPCFVSFPDMERCPWVCTVILKWNTTERDRLRLSSDSCLYRFCALFLFCFFASL